MKKWAIIAGIIVVALAILIGFGFRSCANDKADAEDTVHALFDALDRGDIDAALALYHPDLLERTSAAQMAADLRAIHAKLGPRTSSDLTSWRVNKGSPSFVNLVYESVYANGPAVEEFRLRRVDGKYRIEIHNYNSNALIR